MENEKDTIVFTDACLSIEVELDLKTETVWFLNNNKLLYKLDGSKLIDDNTLVAVVLMVALSDPKERDVVVKIVINLINKNN